MTYMNEASEFKKQYLSYSNKKNEIWEKVIDFTKIQSEGVDIHELLKYLEKI